MLTESGNTQRENSDQRLQRSAMGILATCIAALLAVLGLMLISIDIHTYANADTAAQTDTQSR